MIINTLQSADRKIQSHVSGVMSRMCVGRLYIPLNVPLEFLCFVLNEVNLRMPTLFNYLST